MPALNAWQMAARAAGAFVITLILIRVSRAQIVRPAFAVRRCDNGPAGRRAQPWRCRCLAPFWSTVAASAVIVLLHRAIGWISVRSDRFDIWVNGRERPLVADGQRLQAALSAALITERDLAEAVRKKLGDADLGRVRAATLERDGEISISPLS